MRPQHQQSGSVGADGHERGLAETEHTGQTGQNIDTGDSNQRNKYLSEDVGYQCRHIFPPPYAFSCTLLPAMPWGRTSRNTSIMANVAMVE